MRVIALTQAYNESRLIERYVHHICPLVDQWIISEGLLTPGLHTSERSTDDTRKILENIRQDNITICNAVSPIRSCSREKAEGQNKNRMLELAEPEDGDLIFIGDVDEFWYPDRFLDIVDMFKKNDRLEHVPVEEFQFAYNLRLAFRASHDGRFMRYRKGARFGATNHFIYADGRDVTKDYRSLVPRERSRMCHLCWVKDPQLVRQKVLSFGRPSFTEWFNQVYLEWPDDHEDAYNNNHQIEPYHGRGFAEGQHERLENFRGELPPAIRDFDDDWLEFIREHRQELKI